MRGLILGSCAAAALLAAGAVHAQAYDGTPPYASGPGYGAAPSAGYGGDCEGFTIVGAHAGVTVLGINVGAGGRARIGDDCRGGGAYPPPAPAYAPGYQGAAYQGSAYQGGYPGGYQDAAYQPQAYAAYPPEAYQSDAGQGAYYNQAPPPPTYYAPSYAPAYAAPAAYAPSVYGQPAGYGPPCPQGYGYAPY